MGSTAQLALQAYPHAQRGRRDGHRWWQARRSSRAGVARPGKGHLKVASMVQGLGNSLCSGSPEEMRRRCCGISRPPASWRSASTSGTMSLRSPSWRSRYLRPHRPRHSGRRLLGPRGEWPVHHYRALAAPGRGALRSRLHRARRYGCRGPPGGRRDRGDATVVRPRSGVPSIARRPGCRCDRADRWLRRTAPGPPRYPRHGWPYSRRGWRATPAGAQPHKAPSHP